MNSKGSKLANNLNVFDQQIANLMNRNRGGSKKSSRKSAPRKSVVSAPVTPIAQNPIAPPTPTEPAKPVASPEPTPAPVTPTSTNQQDLFDQEILNLVNQERAKVGADPLKINEQLDVAADLHTLDQASMNNMSHTGSNGSNLGDRIKDAGYLFSSAGENVAYGYGDAATVVTGWMNSEGHRQNILNPGYTEIGIGYAQGANGQPFWTQDFGTQLA
jgi:uncharacterized protein YkwD